MIPQEVMIIDAFPGFNEVDLAEFRINYLKDLVSRVIIVESELTHSGMNKPLYFSSWLEKQSRSLKDRVEILTVDLSNSATSWEREIQTREFLFHYIKQKYPNSKYILSDLDEIPSRSQVTNLLKLEGSFHFHTPTSYRRLNWQLLDSHAKWKLGVMGQTSQNNEPNAGRFAKFALIPGNPGAHFSYLGSGSKEISQKYTAFAHTELNKKYWASEKLIIYCDKYRIDHLGRSRSPGFGLLSVDLNSNNDVIRAARSYFPQFFDLAQDMPPKIMRYIATIRVSSYVGGGFIPRIQQNIASPSFFFTSRSPLVQIGPLFEALATIVSQLRLLLSGWKSKVTTKRKSHG